MKLFRKEEGFTLVELMVVVLIIGILVAVAVPVFNSAKRSAQKRACQSNTKNVETSYQNWFADQDGAPDLAAYTGAGAAITQFDAGVADLTPNFLKKVPVCPTDSSNYIYSFTDPTQKSAIDVSCNNADGPTKTSHNTR